MPLYAVVVLTAAAVALAATPVVSRIASKTGALDKPNERKVHKKPIPRIGGLAIYSAFLVASVLTLFFMDYSLGTEALVISFGLLLCATLTMLLGLYDDYKDMPARWKFLGQIAIASILVVLFDVRIDFISDPFGDYIYLEWFAVPATIFWLVGITNTVNLIDGLDGLAAGVCAIAAFTIMLVAANDNSVLVAIFTAAITGAALGFLFYNFNPASIFMGDCGALFLGFTLAAISVIGSVKSAATITLLVPILALGIPILDTTFAIIRRVRGHVPIFKPDKGHLHHRLLALGFTQRQAVLLVYVISALLGLSAVALTEVSFNAAIIILFIVAVLIILGAKKIGIFSSSF